MHAACCTHFTSQPSGHISFHSFPCCNISVFSCAAAKMIFIFYFILKEQLFPLYCSNIQDFAVYVKLKMTLNVNTHLSQSKNMFLNIPLDCLLSNGYRVTGDKSLQHSQQLSSVFQDGLPRILWRHNSPSASMLMILNFM